MQSEENFWETPRFRYWDRRFSWWAKLFRYTEWGFDVATKFTRLELIVWDRINEIDGYSAHVVERGLDYF